MATAKSGSKPAETTAASGESLKPITTEFSKTSLIAHLSTVSEVDPKGVKAVLAALEDTILASLHKKGIGSFTLPGLLKVQAVHVPAKPKHKGPDPFTKVERVFEAKPASVKIRTRVMKKLKDAAN